MKRNKLQEKIYIIWQKAKQHIFSVGGQFRKRQKLTNIIMEWYRKTIDNIKQLVWLIPAIFDYRIIIGLSCGILFSIFAFNSTETNYKITWSIFAALGNGIVIRYVLEYFGNYPLKERLIENIKTLYSINDFLIKRKNEITNTKIKQLYDFKINEINLAIQRWSDKIKMADIEKIKNDINKIEKSHEANKEKLEIDITELREYGISNEVIANFSGTTIQIVTKIIDEYGNLNRQQRRDLEKQTKKKK